LYYSLLHLFTSFFTVGVDGFDIHYPWLFWDEKWRTAYKHKQPS